MRTEFTTVPLLGRTVHKRGLHPATIIGLAALVGKIQQLTRGEELRPIESLPVEERRDLRGIALAIVNAQDPIVAQRAHNMALERAEAVLAEERAFDSPLFRNLARRIAAEAILMHRLALQGAFDEPATPTTGGVQ